MSAAPRLWHVWDGPQLACQMGGGIFYRRAALVAEVGGAPPFSGAERVVRLLVRATEPIASLCVTCCWSAHPALRLVARAG